MTRETASAYAASVENRWEMVRLAGILTAATKDKTAAMSLFALMRGTLMNGPLKEKEQE